MIDFSISLSDLTFVDIGSLFLIVVTFVYFQWSLISNTLKRSNIIRISLSFSNMLILLSIFGLIVQPKFRVFEKVLDKELRLYTNSENYGEDLIDDLKQDLHFLSTELYDSIKIQTNKQPLLDQFIRQKSINYPKQLFQKPLVGADKVELHLLGDGLTYTQAESLFYVPQVRKVFYQTPSNILTGLIGAVWDSKINLGESSYFEASFQQGTDEKENGLGELYDIKLITPTGLVDEEITINDGELIRFNITPKTSGLLTYKIVVISGGEIINEELIPIEVTQEISAKILILQSSPSFETKQLKNWASDQGAMVVVNTRISPKINISRLTNVLRKDKTKYKQLDLTKNLLSEFDLLVIDLSRFQMLNLAQKQNIKEEIKDGLGVFFLINDDAIVNNLPLFGFSDNAFSVSYLDKKRQDKKRQRLIYLKTNSDTTGAQTRLISETTISVVGSFHKNTNTGLSGNTNTYVSDEKNNILVLGQSVGLGRVSFSLLQDSYRWVLNGQKVAHGRYWQHLIENTARTSRATTAWTKPRVASNKASLNRYTGEKHELCFSTDMSAGFNSGKDVPSRFNGSIESLRDNHSVSVLLNKNPILTDHYCTAYWSITSKWHKLEIAGNKGEERSLYFYVNAKNAWKANTQKRKIESTLNYQRYVSRKSFPQNITQTIPSRAIFDWVYWLLIVISLSFIWIERKLLG